MTATSPASLADQLRHRRSQLRLSVKAAAKRAGVNRATWTDWEKGTIPQTRHHIVIEQVVQWEQGSVDQVKAGGQPVPLENHDDVTGETYNDVAEQALWQLRTAFAQQYIRELGEQRAYELGAERAREHIRLYRLQQDMPRRVA